MAKHVVSTLPNGHVRVVTTLDGAAAPERREYVHRDGLVFLLLENDKPIPVAADLSAAGSALLVGDGETLEDAVRRALAQRDGLQQVHVLSVLRDWILCALGLSFATAGASVLGTCSVALVAFAGWAAVMFRDLYAATVALISALALTLAVVAIWHLCQGFPKWKKLVGRTTGATVVITFGFLAWWGGPHVNFIVP